MGILSSGIGRSFSSSPVWVLKPLSVTPTSPRVRATSLGVRYRNLAQDVPSGMFHESAQNRVLYLHIPVAPLKIIDFRWFRYDFWVKLPIGIEEIGADMLIFSWKSILLNDFWMKISIGIDKTVQICCDFHDNHHFFMIYAQLLDEDTYRDWPENGDMLIFLWKY